MKKLRSVLLATMTVALPSVANAQGVGPGWLEDRSRAQGPGFRIGNLELHPGFGAEVGYDSNVFFADRDETGSAIFRLTPHLFVSTLTEQRESEGEGADTSQRSMVEFQAGVSGQVYIFLADEARNNVALNGDIDLNVNPAGRFGFRFTNNFTRLVRPFVDRTAANVSYATDTNVASVTLSGRTRGGVVQTNLGYAFRLHFFEGDAFRYANQFGHQISANTHFRFLPNTTVFWDGTFDYTDFYNGDRAGPLTTANNWRVRTRVGLNGVITPKLSATVAVGYAAAFVQDPLLNDYDTPILLAGLRLRLTPTTTLGFGYEREAVGSVVGLYRTQDRGYLNFQWLLGRSFMLGLDTWVARMDFGAIRDGAGAMIGTEDREDLWFQAKLFAEYRFTDYLDLNASLGYLGNFTDFEYTVDTGMGPIVDPAGFNKFEAWLGVRVFY